MDMKIIQESAMDFMMRIWMRDKNRGPSELTDNEYTLLKQNNFQLLDNGGDMIVTLVMGAIAEYHRQLREKLIDDGIDIGELYF